MKEFKIFVGYDPKEDEAWQVCKFSLERHATKETKVLPLRQSELRTSGIYTRPQDPNASTEFSITRFLTPLLARTNGWSMFVDCDFLFTDDVCQILKKLSNDYAVYVVKHDYRPAYQIKMDGQIQHVYPRKNWSSLMLFNGSHPKIQRLTADIINSAPPSYLHRFEWLDDADIGELPLKWNFLVGEYIKPAVLPMAIHYTNGGPWFPEWRNVDYASLWIDELGLLKERNLLVPSLADRPPLKLSLKPVC